MHGPSAGIDRDWFRERIKGLGISEAEFGRRVGLGRSALSRLLSGERATKAPEVRRIADVLGKPEREVLDRLSGSGGRGGSLGDHPPASTVGGRHPMFGCMVGFGEVVEGHDLTEPAWPEFADYLDREYGPEIKRNDGE